MKLRKSLFTLFVICLIQLSPAESVITNIAALNEAKHNHIPNKRFDMTVTVLSPTVVNLNSFVGFDATGTSTFNLHPDLHRKGPKKAGDIIHISGVCGICDKPLYGIECRDIKHVGTQAPIKPTAITSKELSRKPFQGKWVRVKGTLRVVFEDDIDPDYAFVVINDGVGTSYASICIADCGYPFLQGLVGSDVTVDGFVSPVRAGQHLQIGHIVEVPNHRLVQKISMPAKSNYAIPELAKLRIDDPSEIFSCGMHRTSGRILTLWGDKHILLKSKDCGILRVDLIANEKLPSLGETIDVTGFPETDFLHINLSCATWQYSTNSIPPNATQPQNYDISRLFSDEDGRMRILSGLQGQIIRLTGTIREANPNARQFILCNDDSSIVVDISTFSAFPDKIRSGCVLAVTGTCVMDTTNWRSCLDIPRINNLIICVNRPDDIRILNQPSWWTPQRSRIATTSLFVALLLVLAWNFILRRIVDRRSRQLAAESLAHTESSLRIDERTRLAVELHDSLSQTLSGVSMHVDSAMRFLDRGKMLRKLSIAAQMLQSCREELRNCLWDLRNRALDEPDMTEAIRRTLKPQTGDTELSIRFCVPRKEMSDNTAHMLLRILRELASNAVRHGHATRIKIAGAYEPDTFKLSVHDNGQGFDVVHAPGVAQGHFGLQGIRERLKTIGGTMTIVSSPTSGTKVIMTIHRITKDTTL